MRSDGIAFLSPVLDQHLGFEEPGYPEALKRSPAMQRFTGVVTAIVIMMLACFCRELAHNGLCYCRTLHYLDSENIWLVISYKKSQLRGWRSNSQGWRAFRKFVPHIGWLRPSKHRSLHSVAEPFRVIVMLTGVLPSLYPRGNLSFMYSTASFSTSLFDELPTLM